MFEISAQVAHRAAWAPAKVALRFEGREHTYAEFERAVGTAAGWLRLQGVGPGDRVAFLGPNCPELLSMLYACARLGAIFVPLNARMPTSELGVFVEQCRPRLLVAEAGFAETGEEVAPHLARAFRIGSDELAAPTSIEASDHSDFMAPVLIAFTSGTTGRPKGAVFNHANLTFAALKLITDEAFTADDTALVATPLVHVAALLSLAFPALWAGATVSIQRTFEAGAVLAELASRHVTRFMAPPFITRALAGHPDWPAADLRSLQTVYVGSTFVRGPDVLPWQTKGARVVQGYGMTEAPGIALTPPDADREAVLAGGRAAAFQEVKLAGPSGEEVPQGAAGEIWTRGPAMMCGYWENDEANREAFCEGWFRTGDAGVIDGHGYLKVVDRLKDIIIVGSSNVYPADIEAVLEDCPQIQEAAVVGAPDSELGEVPVACVVTAVGAELTSEEVLALFADRLAAYKRPRRVIFLDALPRNELGKVRRAELRERARRC